MRHLNYSHLLYFWTVASDGSIAKASKTLHLTPQTISGQLKLLDDIVGEPLFERVGRGLALTDAGKVVYQYAEEIFSLGAELAQRVNNGELGAEASLTVGIVESVAKLTTYRILEPSVTGAQPLKITCREGSLEQLLGDLAIHQLDIIISDRPVPNGLSVKAYNHKLGESEIGMYAHRKVAAKYRKKFPAALDQAPILMPVKGHALRRNLDDWFDQRGIVPKVIAEFDDSALLKAFGQANVGLFAAPDSIREPIERMYGVRRIGLIDGVKETYYAISRERKLQHPMVLSVIETARVNLPT